jgi:hypothetical protein
MKKIPFAMPEIFPQETKGPLKSLFNDIQFTLKVPVVNFIFRTLAHYEKFLFIGWQQVRPNMLTVNMEEEASKLRRPELSFEAEKYNWELWYSRDTIAKIRQIIFTFQYVNPKLLLIATAWEESLGYRSINGGKQIEGFIRPGIISGLSDIKLINIPKAPPRTKELLFDITRTHHAYDAASDYRALAFYPIFLEKAWKGTKEFVGTDEYLLMTNRILKTAAKSVHRNMPYHIWMNPQYLRQFYSDKDIAGIMGLVSLFKNFLASLIIDVECFRKFIDNDQQLL